ncbi:MAG: hypothetical protein SGARI_000494 [Bacillariaceae sp.]
MMLVTSSPQQIQESQWNRPRAARRESSLKKNENRVLLGQGYLPGPTAVICGRGKACTASPGNKKLRAYVDSFAKTYGMAKNKDQKSKIVSTIVNLIEEPQGGMFVKFEENTWWKVDEAYAREKIGNLFRDVLHDKYRSSSKAKQARKLAENPPSSSTKKRVKKSRSGKENGNDSDDDTAAVTPVRTSSLDTTTTQDSTTMNVSLSSQEGCMDSSYSSSSGSCMDNNSMHAMMCGSSSNNMGMGSMMMNMNNNGMRPSMMMSMGGSSMCPPFMRSSMASMNSPFFDQSMASARAIMMNRRQMLMSYCNDALAITGGSDHSHNNNSMQTAWPQRTASSSGVDLMPPYPEESAANEQQKQATDAQATAPVLPSNVSTSDTDNDSDDASIATFADDDNIFEEFLT